MRVLYVSLKKFNGLLERAINYLCLLLLLAFILFIVYQILSRALDIFPTLYFTEELSRFAFQWMVFLGTAVAVLHAEHFVLEAFPRGSKADRISRVIRDLSCLIMGIVFVVYGSNFAISGLARTATASGISMIFVYSTFATCGALIILFSTQRLFAAALFGVSAMESNLNNNEDHFAHSDAVESGLMVNQQDSTRGK